MKKKIITLLSLIGIVITLSGCTESRWLYRVNIQQGNVVTPELIQRLHKGMTKEAVCELLGPPLLIDSFNENRWTYIYTYKPGRGKFTETYAIVYFRNNCIYAISSKKVK